MDVEDPNSQVTPTQGTNWAGLIDGIPISSKALVGVLIILYILGVVFPDFMLLWVALVPGNTLGRLIIWNILTGQLFHLSADLVGLVFSCVSILASGKFLPKFWGETEYLMFSGLVALTCGIVTFACKFVGYFFTSELTFLFNPIGGFYGVSTAYAVALKQLEPELELALSLRAKHIPFLIVLIGGLASGFMADSADATLIFVGWIVSWIYLRFFQKRDGATGDSSDSFQFISFFPEFIQPLVRVFLFIGSKCCFFFPQVRASSPTTPAFTSDSPTSPIFAQPSSPSDAERRRQLGIKALDQKLGKIKNLPASITTTHNTDEQ